MYYDISDLCKNYVFFQKYIVKKLEMLYYMFVKIFLGVIMNKNYSTKILTEAGIVLALSYVLNEFGKIYEMPQGGSVTLASMLPLIIYAIRWGVVQGLFTGFAFSLLNIITSKHLYSAPQVFLDYILAFTIIGLAGLALGKNKKSIFTYLPSIVIAFLIRFASHTLSGILFFNVNFKASALYNSFLVPDFLICVVILFVVWNPMQKIIHDSKN